MQVTRVFRNLFIGKEKFIASRAEFKRVMLTGYLALLSIITNLVFMLINYEGEQASNNFLNTAFCAVGITSLLLLRLGQKNLSKLLLFIGAYSIIFIFCCIEPFETGVWVFLVVSSVGALALFGYEQRYTAFTLAGLGAVMFILAYLLPWKLTSDTTIYSEEYIFNNFVLNFAVSLTVSVLILYFMLDVSRFTEKSLEEKEAEAQEKNKELVKLNAELDRFVYSVSHDLRSPLSTIAGLVNIGMDSETTDEAKKYFGLIDNRIKAQDFFIREIIDFYRNSRTELNIEPILLMKEVEDIVREHSLGESVNSISYQVSIPSDLHINTDKIRLKSVLSNLIGNAVKYHDSAKSDRYIRIGAERINGHINIEVEDNGQGIAPEHVHKIFEMFYRASHDSKGSGLGLFIAQETADKLGGKISVNSVLGEGTKFMLTIPSEKSSV